MNSLSFMRSTHIYPRRPPHSLPRGVTATHRPSPDSHRPTQAQQIPSHSCTQRISLRGGLLTPFREGSRLPTARPLIHTAPRRRNRSPRIHALDAYSHRTPTPLPATTATLRTPDSSCTIRMNPHSSMRSTHTSPLRPDAHPLALPLRPVPHDRCHGNSAGRTPSFPSRADRLHPSRAPLFRTKPLQRSPAPPRLPVSSPR